MLDVMQWLFVKSWLVCAVDHLGGPSFGGEPVLLVENDQQRAVPQRVSRLAILVGRPRMDLSDRQQRTRRRWTTGRRGDGCGLELTPHLSLRAPAWSKGGPRV